MFCGKMTNDNAPLAEIFDFSVLENSYAHAYNEWIFWAHPTNNKLLSKCFVKTEILVQLCHYNDRKHLTIWQIHSA